MAVFKLADGEILICTANVQKANMDNMGEIIDGFARRGAQVVAVTECLEHNTHHHLWERMGYVWYGGGMAGIALKKEWEKYVKYKVEDKSGRVLRLVLENGGKKIAVASVYLKPGLDTKKDEGTTEMMRKVCEWMGKFDVAILMGDLNQTSRMEDRWSIGYECKSRYGGGEIRDLEAAGFVDTHKHMAGRKAEWTHSQNTGKGVARSRIDYPFSGPKSIYAL